MRLLFSALVFIHGLLHLIGFIRSFRLAEVPQLTHDIPRPVGIAWLAGALLLITSAILVLLDVEGWWMLAAPGIALSQILIISSWRAARFGTIANVLILFPLTIAIANALPSSYRSIYKSEVIKGLERRRQEAIVTENDLRRLPSPVQKYLRYAGAVGKPRVRNVRVLFTGEIRRSQESGWLEFVSHQYNFFDEPARVFFIESSMFGVPFDGLHLYIGKTATMKIKVASLFTVVDAKGREMNQGETVTMFNDMCVLAPASLVDTTIGWEAIDSLTARASFTNRGITIRATLYFNEAGELVNFSSDDRYLSADGISYTNYTWTTPMKNYRDVDGRRIASYGEAVWQMPSGGFVYGKFDLKEIEYNCEDFR